MRKLLQVIAICVSGCFTGAVSHGQVLPDDFPTFTINKTGETCEGIYF